MFDKSSYRVPQFHFRFLRLAERMTAVVQGKGYGFVCATLAQEVKFALKLLGAAPLLAVDMGANVGEYTAELRRKAPNVEIHAFEPSAVNVGKLNKRFESDSKVYVVPFAVSDACGSATLFSDEPGSGLGSLTKRKLELFDIAFDCQETVSLIKFEDYWADVLARRPIDILKMDIEGHELGALAGFGPAIRAVKVLQFEFGGCNIDTRTYFKDFWYFFAEHAFDVFRITPLGMQRLTRYLQMDESFSNTNFIAVRRSL